MRNDKHILLALQFHDDRLQTGNQILVRFALWVTVVELVLITKCKFFWVGFLDLFCFKAKVVQVRERCLNNKKFETKKKYTR